MIVEELAETIADNQIKIKLQQSIGLNFGSKIIPNPITFEYVADELLQDAADIFAFDMLIQNYDRREGQPNLFQTKEGFILYDHEMAFPYSMPSILIGSIPEPWEFKGMQYVKNHILFKTLHSKGNKFSFVGFISKLTALSDDIIDAIQSAIPPEWQSDELNEIALYLQKARDNANLFEKSLQEALA